MHTIGTLCTDLLARRQSPEGALCTREVAGGELAADDGELPHRALYRRQADVLEALTACTSIGYINDANSLWLLSSSAL